MRFGLFGGAKAKGGTALGAGDSHGYRDFIDYVVEAERLGFHSMFMVEHHFTGIGQVSGVHDGAGLPRRPDLRRTTRRCWACRRRWSPGWNGCGRAAPRRSCWWTPTPVSAIFAPSPTR